MDTRVYDMLHHVLDKLDRIINGDSNINYRIQCDALARENAQLRAQLEERNKEFDRLYDICERMADGYKKMEGHLDSIDNKIK